MDDALRKNRAHLSRFSPPPTLEDIESQARKTRSRLRPSPLPPIVSASRFSRSPAESPSADLSSAFVQQTSPPGETEAASFSRHAQEPEHEMAPLPPQHFSPSRFTAGPNSAPSNPTVAPHYSTTSNLVKERAVAHSKRFSTPQENSLEKVVSPHESPLPPPVSDFFTSKETSSREEPVATLSNEANHVPRVSPPARAPDQGSSTNPANSLSILFAKETAQPGSRPSPPQHFWVEEKAASAIAAWIKSGATWDELAVAAGRRTSANRKKHALRSFVYGMVRLGVLAVVCFGLATALISLSPVANHWTPGARFFSSLRAPLPPEATPAASLPDARSIAMHQGEGSFPRPTRRHRPTAHSLPKPQ